MTVKKGEVQEQVQPGPVPAPEPVKVTTVSEWREKQLNIRMLTLPSGTVFKVKNIDLASLAMQGIITTPLLLKAVKSFQKINLKTADRGLSNMAEEDITAFDKLMRSFALAAVVEPKLTRTADDQNGIPVNDLDFLDIVAIFSECTRGGAEAFAPFFPGRKQ